ncbi:MAG TPA: class I SAM-dependent methyltransferase [Granulicella sp.]|nr:class I SAM-dependent methyltransferase [Granulicella sp.]
MQRHTPSHTTKTANFDLIARLYRPLEYLTLGCALERCRCHFLPDLTPRTRALVLGDGDGRFLARLLDQNPTLRADAVDTSATMLALLDARCGPAQSRLRTHHTDALTFAASQPAEPYDLVVTHFFLDCLTQTEVDALAARIVPSLTQSEAGPEAALWLLSDFRIPAGPLKLPARLLVRCLYLAFRILTGLRVTALPDHQNALTRAGLTCIARHRSLGGVLTTELWGLSGSGNKLTHPTTASPATDS